MVGILVGTVVVERYADMIVLLKKVILSAGKKCYEVLVGKLNEPKLKNLPTIDVYCYVACRETSIIGSKQFMMPLATPHEVLMALKPETYPWESKINTDFSELLAKFGAQQQELLETSEAKQDEQDRDDMLALVKVEHRELVPVFSAQVLSKYEN